MKILTQQQTSDSTFTFCVNGFWSKCRDEFSFSYLQKFWGNLSPQARQDLLKIDKRSILEQARNNMYCSRCYGLLFECFMQIVMFEKSSQEDATSGFLLGRRYGGLNKQGGALSSFSNGSHVDGHDPAVHPWGGLTTAKDGTLTVLSTYIYSKSLTGLQNIFDSARARKRERELLYADACGGGGRGWISQGIPSYGRGHGTREACALHTARLSCDTLVDFWFALGEETRRSLLRMKEEDFIERLMNRFDSKRFCRDCRKNVIREFKALKELKRTRREPPCTHSFCSADSIIQCEVLADSIRADWRQAFMDSDGAYHHFEWAVGTGEGKSDILEFENIGMNKFVNVDGLDLGGLSAFYINLRACKQAGEPAEFSVKAHALKGQECVHNRLVVGDGFVTITQGESIRRFFEHAEEVEEEEEEEEDDDAMDKDGNEMDGECSRPQKHAKSPELAREFLLDAATVIFKEQVEKALREGTARQNAQSVFVCLVLKLLEERVHVACKEIITLEKQTKLLQEEEKEKFEEEERKERRRMKEKEKKQRRKERLKEKDEDNDKALPYSNSVSVQHPVLKDEHCSINDEENNFSNGGESLTELTTGMPSSPNMQDQIAEVSSDCYSSSESREHYHNVVADSGEITSAQDECGYTTSEHSEYSLHVDKFWKDDTSDSVSKCSDRQRSQHVFGNDHIDIKSQFRAHNNKLYAYSKRANGLSSQFTDNNAKAHPRNCAMKHGGEKFQSGNGRKGEQQSSCCCTYIPDYRINNRSKVETAISCWEDECEFKSDLTSDKVRQFHSGTKNYQSNCIHNSSARSHSLSKSLFGNNRRRDQLHTKMVWEPLDSQNKYARRNSEFDTAMLSSSLNIEGSDTFKNESGSATDRSDKNSMTHNSESCTARTSCVCDLNSDKVNNYTFSCKIHSDCSVGLLNKEVDMSLNDSCDVAVGSDSKSEKSHSNLCGGNSNTKSPSSQNLAITTSGLEDASQFSGNEEISPCQRSESSGCREEGMEKTLKLAEAIENDIPTSMQYEIGRLSHLAGSPEKSTLNTELVDSSFLSSEPQVGPAGPPNQNFPFPIFHQAPSTIGYYHPNTIIWPSAPANGLIAMPQLHPYVVSSPLNYGWSGTPGFCMPYGGVSLMEPPLLSQGQVPVYHPVISVSNATGMHQKGRIKISKPTLARDVSFQVHNKTQLVPDTPNGRTSPKADPKRTYTVKENNSGFSLFHFGGPVALSSTLKKGKIDELALKCSVAHGVEVDHIYSKKEAITEEYSLFAASNNGFKFSF